MGLRFRRTIKLMPGVRLNVTKTGVSATVGPRGLHTTVSSRRVTNTVGIPGSGLSLASVAGTDSRRSRPRRSPALLRLSVLAAVIACIASFALAAEPQTVIGLTFDQILPLNECPFMTVTSGGQRYYKYPAAGGCIAPSSGLQVDLSTLTDSVLLKYASSEVLPLTSAHDVGAVLVEGKLVELTFSTSGVSDQDLVMSQLVAKFGQPTTSTTTQVGNVLGAKFDSRSATWLRPELRVVFDATRFKITQGSVEIATPAGAERRDALRKSLVTPTTPL